MTQSNGAGGPGFGRRIERRDFLRLAGGAAIAAAAAPALAACASPSEGAASAASSGAAASAAPSAAASATDKSLTLMLASWVPAPFVNEVMIEAAAASMGVDINLVTVEDGTFANQAVAAQESGQAPDVIFWVAQGIPILASAGYNLLDLTNYASSEDKAAFYPQDYIANTFDGGLYGLGFRATCRGMAYRGDYAEAAGPVPESWTFDEFGSWVTKLGGPGRTAFGYEAKTGDGRASSNFLPLLYSTGGNLVVDEGGKWVIGFTPEQMESVMTFYFNTVNTWKCTPPEVANWGWQETDGNFAKGTLACYSSGPWVKPGALQYPETLENIKVAPLPYASKPANFWEEHNLMISQASTKQDLAWQFLETMRSEEIQKLIIAHPDVNLSVRPGVNAQITDPILAGFAPGLDVAVVPEPINVMPIMNNAIFPALQAMALEGTAPSEVTAQVMANMQSTLDEMNQG